MTLFFSTLLSLSALVPLTRYRDYFPVQNNCVATPVVRQEYVVEGKMLDEENTHNVEIEKIEFYADKWKEIIGKVMFYRLQFYNGKDRSKATNLLNNLSNQFPSVLFDLEYEHANFNVRSQKYFSLIEALDAYRAIGYINVIIIHGEDLY